MTPDARWLCLMLAALLLVACKTAVSPPTGAIPDTRPPDAVAPPSDTTPDQDTGLQREQAAAALTERGRTLMADGQIDPAMRLFEQALSLAPRYGPGYYYLAEAWLAKNNFSHAQAFHHQAALYLEDNSVWQRRVVRQRRRIDRAAAAALP